MTKIVLEIDTTTVLIDCANNEQVGVSVTTITFPRCLWNVFFFLK